MADTNYEDFLPAANIIVGISSKLLLRYSMAKTIVRPSPSEFRAGQSIAVTYVDVQRTIPDTVTISLGNPNLKPFNATSLDASLEWYNRSGSAVTGAAFFKRVKNGFDPNFLCPTSLSEIDELRGVDFGSVIRGNLSTLNGACVDAAGTEVGVQETINDSDSFDIWGLELGLLQNFDFLPGAWKNFGVQANYTYINAAESGNLDPSGNPLPLENVSKHTFNVILYYETKRLGFRLAHNFRDDYFVAATSGGSFFGDDRIIEGTHQLDASASFNVTEKFTLGLEAFNVLNAKRIEFQGTEQRFRSYDYDGRTVTFSARYRF